MAERFKFAARLLRLSSSFAGRASLARCLLPLLPPLPLTWRWIPPLIADGVTQMALDRWMLQRLVAGAGPMLRLYRWSRPTLSLGLHQQTLPPHWLTLAEAGVLDLVRRPSGGRAVLHAGDLTYALVCRPGTSQRTLAYEQACRWLVEAFAELGEPLQFGQAAPAQAHQRRSCFASATAADLVDARGAKRIGSAQLWRGAALLQHGSVLLAPDRPLWCRVFCEPPPELTSLAATPEQLDQTLRAAACLHLCAGAAVNQPLTPEEWQEVETLKAQVRAAA